MLRYFIFIFCFPLFPHSAKGALEDSGIIPPVSASQKLLVSLNHKPSGKPGLYDSGKLFNSQREKFKFYTKADYSPYTVFDSARNDIVFRLEVFGKLDWRVSDTFSVYIQGSLLGRDGFTQSLHRREHRKEGFNFLEWFVKYDYSRYLELQHGFIKQDFLKAPLLMTDRTFPALLESFSFSLPWDIQGRLVFQQAIPNSADEDVRRSSQIKDKPYFFTHSLFMKTKSHPLLFNSDVEENLTFFHFTELPSAVALKGKIYGNSIRGEGSASEFKYGFFGLHNNLKWKFPVHDSWIVELGWDHLWNFRARSRLNMGGRYYISVFHDFYNLMEIRGTWELFGNQSDSSVAFYNSELYGHNNRQGFGLELKGHFYQSGLTVGARYIFSRPIEKQLSPFGEGHYFAIHIGTNYVSI